MIGIYKEEDLRHDGWKILGRLDRRVFTRARASDQPADAQLRHSDDRAVDIAYSGLLLRDESLDGIVRALHRRLDPPIHRPLFRRQTARVYERLEIPPRRHSLVAKKGRWDQDLGC